MDEIGSSSAVFGRHLSSRELPERIISDVSSWAWGFIGPLTEKKLLLFCFFQLFFLFPLPPLSTVEPQTNLIGWNDAVLTPQGCRPAGRLRCVNSPQPNPTGRRLLNKTECRKLLPAWLSVSVGQRRPRLDEVSSVEEQRRSRNTCAHRCWCLCRVQ